MLHTLWYGEVDSEGYRIDFPSYPKDPSALFMTYMYERTWCHYLKTIADGLPKLQHFRFTEEMFREVSPQSREYVDLLLP